MIDLFLTGKPVQNPTVGRGKSAPVYARIITPPPGMRMTRANIPVSQVSFYWIFIY